MLRTLAISTMLACCALACAARQPVIYTTQSHPEVERAIRICAARADEAKANGSLGLLARRSAEKARETVPAAAVAAVLSRGSGAGAWTGAAVGAGLAVAGATIDSLEDDSLYVKYMQVCLGEQGHSVLGWR